MASRVVMSPRSPWVCDAAWHSISMGRRVCLGVAHHFHVRLRHRLLPQPGGFEGVRFGLVELDVTHLAPGDRPQLSARRIDLDPASPATTPDPACDDYPLLVHLNDLLGLPAELLPRFEEGLEQLPRPLAPSVDASV